MNETGVENHQEDVTETASGASGVPLATMIDQIRKSPLGQEMSPEECGRLAVIAEVRQLGPKEFLLEEGRLDDSLHIVATGALEVLKSDQGGESITLHLLKAGDIAGELGFVDGTPHAASLRATAPTTVLTIHRDRFEALLDQEPALVYKAMRGIVRTIHDILGRMNFQYVQMTNYITKQHGRF